MPSLAEEHPQEYPKGSPPLPEGDARSLAGEVPDWELGAGTLSRTLTFKDFRQAFSFVTVVALLAEAESHHPDISLSWNRLDLTFRTHTAGGLTRNDFIMAAKVDHIPRPGT